VCLWGYQSHMQAGVFQSGTYQLQADATVHAFDFS
jgi:hypothetical protein